MGKMSVCLCQKGFCLVNETLNLIQMVSNSLGHVPILIEVRVQGFSGAK